ncbi:MAG: RluA family pseudouridine synthase [Planctomycetes bacterium]|nr:RluA family pseudouridine synthase [Planctomycetota bacterium]
MADEIEFIVPREEHEQRLDRLLVARFPGVSRTALKGWIDGGLVLVGSRRARKAGESVPSGTVVRVAPPAPPPPPSAEQAAGLRVLYEDGQLAVIDKPAGMSTHPNANDKSPTVSELAAVRWPDLPRLQGEDRPGIVHRLDRFTSGVMVLALNEPAMAELKAQFKNRTVQKEYRALVYGEPAFDSAWIDRPIGRDPAHPEMMSVTVEAGREAQTYYQVLERYEGFAYVRCLPKTGRTHQIRVHLTSEGLPLLGDKVYRTRLSRSSQLPSEFPPVERQFLHAHGLQFAHPTSQERLEFVVPLPDDMRAVRDFLRVARPVGERG